MWQKFNNKYSQRAFAAILILLILLFCLALWYINKNQSNLSPASYNFFQSLLVAVITSLVATSFMGAIYWFFLPKEKELHQIQEIDPQTTIEYFDIALSTTTFWGYHGHIGRWVRNAAIPALSKKSRERGEVIQIHIIIIDPCNAELCKIYSSYGNTTRFREKNKKDVTDVQAELYTTILKSVIANQMESIEVRVFLACTFTGLRKDISDNVVFLTRIDPRAPAMMVEKEITKKPIETMYTMLRTDFEYAKKQSREVDLSKANNSINTNSSIADYANTLVDLGFYDHIEDIDRNLLEKVYNLVDSYYHPYN
jgi:hypothetical protein